VEAVEMEIRGIDWEPNNDSGNAAIRIDAATVLHAAVDVMPEPTVVRGMECDAEDFCRKASDIQADIMRVFEE